MFRYTDKDQNQVRHEEEGWTILINEPFQSRWHMIYKEWLDEGNVPLPAVPPTNEQVMAGIRIIRNDKLAESDWTQMPGALSDTAKAEWDTYRQALRDLPSTINDAIAWNREDSWPVKPE